METFLKHFNRSSETIRSSFRTNNLGLNPVVNRAYDDISEALDLSYGAVAVLVWALGNMGDNEMDLDKVASQTGYTVGAVSSAIDELERHHYMVEVKGHHDCIDLTASTKEMLINHYCFYKLFR